MHDFWSQDFFSLGAAVSYLKGWRAYAFGVLNYARESTLPPRSCKHMLMFINIFRNGHSAMNYAGSVRWAGKMRELSESWDQPIIVQVLRGSKKLTLRLLGAKLDLRKALGDETAGCLN